MGKNELIQEILNLNSADREYVRDVVSASLSQDLPPQLSPADQQDLLRRIESYDTLPENFISWETLKARCAAQRAGQS